MLQCVAVDDEPLSLKIIANYCEKNPDLELVKTFNDLISLKNYLDQFPVDLLFLDIHVANANGVEFYKTLNNEIPVIFTTAFSEYAVEGFEVSALDYLLKPFTLERFNAAVTKATKRKQFNLDNNIQQTISIRADYQTYIINIEDIKYIEGLDDYIQIYLEHQPKIVARFSLKKMEEELPSYKFIRVHRSYIVPLEKVISFQSKSIKLKDLEIPIGDTYKTQVIKALENK